MFSIITPTFNRQDTLHRVYDSLRAQTFTEFHWVIVDDASQDETTQLVNSWMSNENGFDIQYHKLPENKGKPFALNFGFDFCTEPITVIADSDDSFESYTLSDLQEIWNTIDNTTESEKICAVWTLVKNEEGQIVGDLFPKNFWQVNFRDRVLNRKKLISGEKWHSWRTNVLKEHRMCHNDNTKYIGESATWERINYNYDILCVNMVHRTYWQTDDGLMNQNKSSLKVAKIKYYTTYYQLNHNSISKILSQPYYRSLAFDYIKSTFKYSDKENKLGGLKQLGCFLIFLFGLPVRVIKKVG